MDPGYMRRVHICALTLRPLFKIVLMFFRFLYMIGVKAPGKSVLLCFKVALQKRCPEMSRKQLGSRPEM